MVGGIAGLVFFAVLGGFVLHAQGEDMGGSEGAALIGKAIIVALILFGFALAGLGAGE